MSIFLTFIFWLISGSACSYFASKRGRDPYGWFAIGLFFGVFGLVVLFLLKPLNQESKVEEGLVLQVPKEDLIEKKWFYINSGSPQQGPFGFTTLQILWNQEKISQATFVWCEGMDSWKRIEDLPDIIQVLLSN